jgi:protein phosphatase
MLRDRPILCVQGNHDENAIRHAKTSANFIDPRDETSPLDGDTLGFIEQLPASRTLTCNGTKVMLTHAIPSDNGGAAFQDESNRKLSKRFKKDLARIDADILIVGHTHYPFDVSFRGKRIINPGCICRLQSRDSHTYGILDLSNQAFAVIDVSAGESCDMISWQSC